MTDVELEIAELEPGDRPGYEAYAALWNAVVPRYPITPDELERSRARRPGDVRLVGRIDWAVAGAPQRSAPTSRAEPTWASSSSRSIVVSGWAVRSLERAAAAARGHGSEVLAAGVEEGDEAGEAFAARFGLREVLRDVEIVRELRGDELAPEPPEGIELVALSKRPDLLDEVHELASVTLPEMPLHAPFEMPSFERWVEKDATGPDVLAGGTLVALDDDRVVGFAGLIRRAADPRLAEHGLTYVAASHRNRGIATALKRAQIAWAAQNGFRELQTATQDGNAPMRAIIDRLGYEPRPAWIRMEAPLEEVEAALRR
jgi:RimJ/RimL family protein N-acetyltransferase